MQQHKDDLKYWTPGRLGQYMHVLVPLANRLPIGIDQWELLAGSAAVAVVIKFTADFDIRILWICEHLLCDKMKNKLPILYSVVKENFMHKCPSLAPCNVWPYSLAYSDVHIG